MRNYTNYLSIPGLTLTWYNSQDDNELFYDGIHADMVDIQEAVYNRYCKEHGTETYDEDVYTFWLLRHKDYIIDEMRMYGDWLFDNKAVGHGRYHSFLEPWKYNQMREHAKEAIA